MLVGPNWASRLGVSPVWGWAVGGHRAGNPLVLLVDDNADTLHALETLVGMAGYEVATARDGLEALEYLKKGRRARVGLIVLDLSMPRLDGHAFLEVWQCEADLRKIPVIVFSAKDPRQPLPLGVRYVSKGYADPDDLLGAIAQDCARPPTTGIG